MIQKRIVDAVTAKHPKADFSRYFTFLCSTSGTDHKHHIAPKAIFPELKDEQDNKMVLGYQEHFYAHYLLALAAPECVSYQYAFYMMANFYATDTDIRELSHYAEVYERGMRSGCRKGGDSAALIAKKKRTGMFAPDWSSKSGGHKGGLATAAKFTPEERSKRMSKLGRLGGRARIATMTPEELSEFGRNLARAGAGIGGRIGGPIGGRKTASIAGHMSRAGRIGGRIGGVVSTHNRWHVKRGIKSQECLLCQS
jgi:hypothetical protein